MARRDNFFDYSDELNDFADTRRWRRTSTS
jgi:hypothetical protein